MLVRDRAGDGVRVDAPRPGFLDTPFNAPVRMASSEEISAPVAFILGDAATCVACQAIAADGDETIV